METAVTNRADIYLLDSNKAFKVTEWLKEVAEGADELHSFIEKFPDDPVVVEYQKRGTPKSLEELQLQISIVASKMPIKIYFDAHGLTDHFLMKKVKTLLHSENEDIVLKTLKLVLKYKNPIEKPTPIQAKQNNFYLGDKSVSKEQTMEKIMDMINGGSDLKIAN